MHACKKFSRLSLPIAIIILDLTTLLSIKQDINKYDLSTCSSHLNIILENWILKSKEVKKALKYLSLLYTSHDLDNIFLKIKYYNKKSRTWFFGCHQENKHQPSWMLNIASIQYQNLPSNGMPIWDITNSAA